MTDDSKLPPSGIDSVLVAMERKYSFHRDMADKILRDIDDYKRIRAEYPDLNSEGQAQPGTPAPSPAVPDLQTRRSSSILPKPRSRPMGQSWRDAPFDGTFAGLVRRYRTEGGSPYFKLHAKVRRNYDLTLNKLMLQIGHERIVDLVPSKIQELYDGWKAGGKISTAHGYIAKVRLLAHFGSKSLNNDECSRLSMILNKMEFELPSVRTERLTAEQATAIRAKAHEMGRSSIALAQAIQFDLKFKQVETIGEYVSVNEPNQPESDLVWNGEKWIRGLRWDEIDERLVLRRPVNWREPNGETFSKDLKECPMIKEELDLINLGSRTGPVVVCEWTGKPWSDNEFRRWWRKVADEAGIPKEVKNMDSRAEPVRTGRFADMIDDPKDKPNVFN